MYCNQCGIQNPDDASFCSKCGSNLKAENPIPPLSIESKKQDSERSLTLKILVGLFVLEIVYALSQLIWISVIFKAFTGYNIWYRKKWAAYVVAGAMVPVTFLMGIYYISQEETIFQGFGTVINAIILFVLIIYSWKEYSN